MKDIPSWHSEFERGNTAGKFTMIGPFVASYILTTTCTLFDTTLRIQISLVSTSRVIHSTILRRTINYWNDLDRDGCIDPRNPTVSTWDANMLHPPWNPPSAIVQ